MKTKTILIVMTLISLPVILIGMIAAYVWINLEVGYCFALHHMDKLYKTAK